MSDFEIVPATEKDCGLILEFIRKLAQYERLLHEVVGTEADVKRELFGEDAVAHCVIGYHEGKPVAFALYFFNFSTFMTRKGLYLEDIFVEPEYRGHGFGKQLMHYLARVAKEKGCARFEWVVLEWNTPAIGFYEKIGAKLMTDWRLCRLTGQALTDFAGEQ